MKAEAEVDAFLETVRDDEAEDMSDLILDICGWSGKRVELSIRQGFVAAKLTADHLVKKGLAEWVEVRQVKNNRKRLHTVRSQT